MTFDTCMHNFVLVWRDTDIFRKHKTLFIVVTLRSEKNRR